MKVMKFGGSSVVDAKRQAMVANIIGAAATDEKVCVVVSAMGGVTDELVGIARAAKSQDKDYRARLVKLRTRHHDALSAAGADKEARQFVDAQIDELSALCDGIFVLNELSAKVLDRVMGVGELCSAQILTAACRKSGLRVQFTDTRDLCVTDDTYGAAVVDFAQTNHRIARLDFNDVDVRICPGFVAGNSAGSSTTLGRNGSDYTAAILGAGLSASEVEIWTDVNGVLSANPQMVSGTVTIDQLSYEEAMELSHFGAKVIHAPTMQPVMKKGIDLVVKNTFDPGFAGTRISKHPSCAPRLVSGISSISNVAFVRVEGSGMVGVRGVAGRLFSALAQQSINLIMISQGSSEHSICFAVASDAAESARVTINAEFRHEIEQGRMDPPIVETQRSVLAVVGEKMRQTPGIAAKVFSALGDQGVSITAIAQGSSERNISMVIDRADEQTALSAIHAAFFSR